MSADRYLKIVLTIIALELAWLAANGLPESTFAQAAGTPVIITGVRLEAADESVLPVAVRGTVTIDPNATVKVESDRPLLVESVPYTPSLRPGEPSTSRR